MIFNIGHRKDVYVATLAGGTSQVTVSRCPRCQHNHPAVGGAMESLLRLRF